jgi:hypothetical protein
MSSNWLVLAVVVGALSVGAGFAQEAKPSDLTPANQTDKNPPITNESLPAGARLYLAPCPMDSRPT